MHTSKLKTNKEKENEKNLKHIGNRGFGDITNGSEC